MLEYYFLDANEVQHGPISGEQLLSYGVTPGTLVWAEGMADWVEAGRVADLAPLFADNGAATAPSQLPPSAYTDAHQTAEPSSNLALAILSTLCCNPVLGIIAVIFSLQSIFFVREGMLYDARRVAVRSKSCSYTAIFMGLAVLALLLFLSAVGAIAFDDVILFFRDYSY